MGNNRLSVINQMLKDLDQRQADKNSALANNAVLMANNHASKKVIIVSIAVVVLLNIIGLFFWQLYNENQLLKAQQKNNNTPVVSSETQKNAMPTIVQATNAAEPVISVNKATVNPAEFKASASVEKNVETNVKTSIQAIAQHQITPVIINPDSSTSNSTPNITKTNIQNNKINKINNNRPLTSHTGTVDNSKVLVDRVSVDAIENKTAPAIPSNLTISRRKMSPQDLAKQKFSRAKQAFLDNDIMQAELLFEEILLLTPNHKQARKQLAALWFGRQSYQPALNLLSQGIALAPQDSEYRLMQARIYLNQGQGESALQTLVVLADAENIEYQTLLASTAQQQGQFLSAIKAYQQLVHLQANKGRWWLGLAIAFDSNSQFLKAKQAYQTAIAQHNLSTSSAEFAQKRLIELGE
ncbi:MAG: MSHA biogenesis protein MshN [Alteromonadaceae bacterium]|jgi:MSHA biogenesis protein MshN